MLKVNKNWYKILHEASVSLGAFGLGGVLGIGSFANPVMRWALLGLCGLCLICMFGVFLFDLAMKYDKESGKDGKKLKGEREKKMGV